MHIPKPGQSWSRMNAKLNIGFRKGFGGPFLYFVSCVRNTLDLEYNTNGWECNSQSSPISPSKSGEIACVLFISFKHKSFCQMFAFQIRTKVTEFSLWIIVSKVLSVMSSRFPAIEREALRLSKRKRERPTQTDVQFSNAKLGLGPDFWLFAQQFLISLTSARLVYIETDPEKMAQLALRHQTSLWPRWERYHNSAKGSWKANIETFPKYHFNIQLKAIPWDLQTKREIFETKSITKGCFDRK